MNQPVFDGVGWADPVLLSTLQGLRDPTELTKLQGTDEDDRAKAWWVEYRDGDVLVHRSAQVQMKKLPPGFEGFQGAFS